MPSRSANGGHAVIDGVHEVRETASMLPQLVTPSIVSVMCTDRGDGADGEPSIEIFARASDALRAAVELQTAHRRAGDPDLRAVRVAVDTGEIDAPDVTAIAERCRRLLRLGQPGQILATSTTVEIAGSSSADAVDLRDLGTHHVRGISAAVWIWQVDARGASASFPPLRTREAAAALLPVPDTSFIGRDADLASLIELLGLHRILSIVGAGGCGKTRLAIELAVEVLARFRNGICWVDLAPVADSASIVDVTAAAVGLRTTADVSVDRIADHLAHRSLLLVFDNCEHLVGEAAHVIASISSACPAVRILATSREPLALHDEVVWRIPSLDVPDGSDLLGSDAGRLLLDRIHRVRPGYHPDADDAAALAEICRRLDGIPLAVELAAARLRTISPSDLANRLDERFALLAGARNAVARQRTLEASVAWSYQLLDDDEQRALRRLSVCAGSFSIGAAIHLCDHVADPEPIIARLRDCSLLVDRPGPGDRLQTLEPVRWFARERLVDSGEADATLGRHSDWYAATARALGAELEGPGVQDALAMLDADVANLRLSLEWSVTRKRGLDAARTVAATSWFWVWRGCIAEAERWLDRADIDETRLDPADRLALVWARSELIGNRAGGIDDLVTEGLALARAHGDRRLEARLLVSHSRYRAFRVPHETIEQAPAERALCREVGEPFWVATSYVGEALAQISLGRFDLAEPLLDRLRSEARALRHPQLIADEIARRAVVDRRFGRYDAVLRAVVEIDRITAGFTTLNSQALVHAQAALVDVAQGRAEVALDAMDELYRRYLVAGELGYLPSIALPMIDALIDLGRPEEALDRFERLWRGFGKVISWRLRLGSVRATAMLASGDLTAARDAFTTVLDEARSTLNDHEAAIAERYLAAIDRAEGGVNDAETRLHRALEIQAGLGYPQYVASVLEELAGIELEHRRARPAAVLFGAASTIRFGAGVTRRIGCQHLYEADVASVREQLGDEFERQWTAGAVLDIEHAVEFARRGRGERRRPATGWDSLTVTERKVAALVADGRTNPEIASALIMGRATVKTHVSNILDKLSLANRTQIATESLRQQHD
jgi:predicted ATPase/DNA-binding CsgD family transcriptional regulator